MVKITFLGSCREVGRSAVLVESNKGQKCLLDYGVRFREEERLPFKADLTNLKAVALTHCHIDHSGAIPFLYKNQKNPTLYSNPLTLDITEKLIEDMLKVSKYPYPFGLREIKNMNQNSFFLKNEVTHRVSRDFSITFYDAGHVPGSVSIVLQVDGKKILYTGDINNKNTNLVNSANSSEIPEIDVAIMESTYALREHPPRAELEKEFVEKVNEITENGGKVLIPAFGVARSQEAIMILNKYHYRGKIFVDGMAKLIAKIYFDHPYALKNKSFYRKALSNAKFINRRRSRVLERNKKAVIVSPSGMLKGGAALEYIKPILTDSTSAIFLVGYQVEGTPGRNLIDKGVFQFKENDAIRHTNYNINIDAKCEVKYFDFSSHADALGLEQYIDNVKFRNHAKQVFCIHGDNKAATTLSGKLVEKDYYSVAPEVGEVYKI